MNKEQIQEIVKFSKNLSILYVEDNEITRGQTLKVLSNFFTNITVAIDGEDGLRKFKRDEYHIVITDINMPNKNGIDMLKAIKIIDDEIFCLIISAHNEAHYFIDAIELGVDGFLMKPVKLDQFSPLMFKIIKRVQNALEIKELAVRRAKLASLGEMIDSIAHQWKQPLSVIRMRLQMLELALDTNSITDEKIIETIQSSELQVNHLLNTMEEFRTFFRPNTKKEIILLKSIIDSSIILIKDELIANTIGIEIIGDITVEVNLNANEFKHIILNIINNAKDAFNGNDILYDKRKITFDIQTIKESAILNISDTAGGIPNDVIPYIFDSNFTTKGHVKGTGMGLYMTKQIIEKIDATIKAYNNKDGACFRIVI